MAKTYGNADSSKHSFENYLKIHGVHKGDILTFLVNNEVHQAIVSSFSDNSARLCDLEYRSCYEMTAENINDFFMD